MPDRVINVAYKILPKLDRISVVLATWCPHCVPLSLENVKRMSKELHVPYRVLDIDRPDQVKTADEMVRQFGDDSEDYIVPQVFAEFSDGTVKHILTGSSEGIPVTTKRWENIFRSEFYNGLKQS